MNVFKSFIVALVLVLFGAGVASAQTAVKIVAQAISVQVRSTQTLNVALPNRAVTIGAGAVSVTSGTVTNVGTVGAGAISVTSGTINVQNTATTPVFVSQGIFSSSFTLTTGSGNLLTAAGVLKAVIVGSRDEGTDGVGKLVQLYNAVGNASGQVGQINTRAPGTYIFDVALSSGLYVVNTGTAAVTIIYK